MENRFFFSGLVRTLIDNQLLEQDQAKEAQAEAEKEGVPFVTYLVQNKIVTAHRVAELASRQFGLVLYDIASLVPETALKEFLSEKLARQYRAVPLLRRGNELYVAISDPGNQQVLRDIQFSTNLHAEAVLVEDDKLGLVIDSFYEQPTDALGGLDEESDLETSAITGGEGGVSEEDAPVVKFVNRMLVDAVRDGASDLHFEPYEKIYRVRFRMDGMLSVVAKPPVQLGPKISARLKVMSGLDISERRKPQDGRIKVKISKTKSIDLRVNTLPTLWGEKVVMRILDPTSAQMGIDALGYEADQKQLYLNALSLPQGMILVTGPTGSGKTVSLYTGLNILNTADVNISTAEDPVEINLEGINQVNVNPRQGMDFAQALRAFLRQDPDVIMVGEIRDLETAEIAIKAAQTGHLVLSTLHTNSAAETLTRLRNMGVAAFNLATSVRLIIAQRLARRLCSSCKEELSIPRETLIKEGFPEHLIGTFKVYGPVGCDHCKGGYKGRVGVYEVVRITPALELMIMEERNSIEIDKQARVEGFNDLRTSGLEKVMHGLTSLEEVNRVTSD